MSRVAGWALIVPAAPRADAHPSSVEGNMNARAFCRTCDRRTIAQPPHAGMLESSGMPDEKARSKQHPFGHCPCLASRQFPGQLLDLLTVYNFSKFR